MCDYECHIQKFRLLIIKICEYVKDTNHLRVNIFLKMYILLTFVYLFSMTYAQKAEDTTRPNSRASPRESLSSNSHHSMSDDDTKLSLTKVDADGEPEINEVKVTYANYPDDCFCKICRRKCPCCIRFENTKWGKKAWKIRCLAYALVEHKYFETFIITMILASSIALVSAVLFCDDSDSFILISNHFTMV